MYRQSSLFIGLFLSLFLVAAAVPATAQTIEVRNGGTLEVSNGGVWDLQDVTTVDLGPVGSTVSITETGGARFANGILEATRDLNAPNSRDVASLGAQISASADLGATTVTRGHAIQNAPNGNEGIARYYDLSPSQNNSGLSATLTFSYHDDELRGLSESNLELFKSTDGGQSWNERGQDGRDANANTVTLNGIDAFSRWTLGSTQSPLPVELASFEAAQIRERTVELTWQTTSEQNNAGFEVQHKPGSEEAWQEVGFVESKASSGTTTETTSYRSVVEDLPVGTHQFRLRQVDLDGTARPYEPVSVRLQMQEALTLSGPAPNPASHQTTLTFAVKNEIKAQIGLYNMLGQRVRTPYEGRPTAGESQRIRLDTRDLSSGVYVLRLEAGGKLRTRRLTVVR